MHGFDLLRRAQLEPDPRGGSGLGRGQGQGEGEGEGEGEGGARAGMGPLSPVHERAASTRGLAGRL